MSIPRRRFLQLATAAGGLAALPRAARAQSYPTRPVRIIVATSAGGSTDIAARVIGQWLTERLGQSFVVENRPGGGNNIGTEAAVRAPADGYTLLMANTVNAINTTLYDNLGYNFVTDMAPVAILMRTALLMQVHPSVPVKTAAEFIDYAKANPGKINMGSGGNGATGHVSGELFKMMAGVQMVHVPYRGEAPALTDLIAGQVQVVFTTIGSSIQYIRAGKLRALAVTTTRGRMPCRRCRRWRMPCRATRRAAGTACARPRIRPSRSSKSSTGRSTPASAIPRSRRASRTWARRRSRGTPSEFGKHHCRGHREVGEGDQVLGRQAELISGPQRPDDGALHLAELAGPIGDRDYLHAHTFGIFRVGDAVAPAIAGVLWLFLFNPTLGIVASYGIKGFGILRGTACSMATMR